MFQTDRSPVHARTRVNRSITSWSKTENAGVVAFRSVTGEDERMKLVVNTAALIVSIITSILFYGTILKFYDLITPWWMTHFPGTEPLFLPFLWAFMYFDPSIAAFVAGLARAAT